MIKSSMSVIVVGLLIFSSIQTINATSVLISQNKDSGSVDFAYDNAIQSNFVPGEILVKFKDSVRISAISNQDNAVTGVNTIDSLNEKFGISSIEKLSEKETSSSLSNVYKLKFTQDKSISSILEEYLKDPNVEYAEPNYIISLFNTPNDPKFYMQWALNQANDVDIDAPEAWGIETGNKNVVIAIVDSGIDYNHPDLKNNIWINDDEIPGNYIDDDENGFIDDTIGWDFISNINDPKDELGHGTHCAGIVGAVGNNNIGISGACWNCSIMPVKIFSDLGVTDLGLLVRGLNYAADNGADVISMSFGGYAYSQILKDTLDYAYSKGCILVSSAGNEATYLKSYPASYDNVISVAAINSNNDKANFSNYGAWVDVAAPGVDIYSTMPTYHVTLNDEPYGCSIEYSDMSGTSMSCPYVAGVAGLILSKNPDLNQEEIKTLIHSAVSKVNSSAYIGTGNINAFKCIQNSDAVPLAFLDSLLDEEEIEGVIEIRGTASGITFKEFRVYLGFGQYPASWNLIDTSNTKVENNVLTTLDTTLYKDGVYSIKLELEDIDGHNFEDRTIVLINNDKTTVYVDDDGPADYQTIGEAKNNSGQGDRIFVYNGTYYEDVRIEKSIDLIGENKNTTTIVGFISYRNSQNAEVSGFTFRQTKPTIYNTNLMWAQYDNYKYQYGPDASTIEYIYPCLSIRGCSNVTIKNNIFVNYTAPPLKPHMIAKGIPTLSVGIGIDLMTCSACLVKNNILLGHIYNPSIKKEGNSATIGIYLLGCSSVFVENNLILNNNALQKRNVEEGSIITSTNESLPAGIFLQSGTSNRIDDNKIENNFKGIQLFGEKYSSISNNLLTRNTHGIYSDMVGALFLNIHHNRIQDNKNGIGLGVASLYNKIYNNIIENSTIGIKGLTVALKIFEGLMPDSQYNIIHNNSIKNNDIGVYGINWANNTICDNNIENNKKIGLKLVKSKHNRIYRNNFINDGIILFGKSNAKSSIGNKWDNGKQGNYWDDYRGLRFKKLVDLNKDGFGNIPYRIPRLQIDRHPKLEPYDIEI